MEPKGIPQQPEKKFSWWRFLRRTFIWSFLSFFFLIILGVILLKIYEDEIKGYAVGILNENLTSPVYVEPGNIDVSFISSFPYASVDFNNMSALDAWDKKKKDTLFKAEKISLLFNIMDVLGGSYNFKQLDINGLYLTLRTDNQGRNNYSIFKTVVDSTDADTSGFSLNLEHIRLSDSYISYNDLKTKTVFVAGIPATNITGIFSNEKYELGINSNLQIKVYSVDSAKWITDKPLIAELVLDVNKNEYVIRDGKIRLAELALLISGKYTDEFEEDHVNFKIAGDNIGIASTLSLLPAEYAEDAKRYESDGELNFEADLAGRVSDPFVTSTFSITNGTLKENSTSTSLEEIELRGKFQGSDLVDENRVVKVKSNLTIENFNAEIEGGKVSGKMKVVDLDKPILDLELRGSIGLNDLNGFVKIDTISSLDGSINMNISYKGPLKSGKEISIIDLDNISASGTFEILEGNIKLKNCLMEFSDINGNFELQNADVEVKSFSGKALGTDFLLKGYFRDVAKYLLDEKYDMRVEANFASEMVDLNELLANNNAETKSDTAYNLSFPDRIDLKLQTKIEKTVFRDFEATKIRGELLMRDQKLIMDPVTFNTMDGSVNTMLMVDADREEDILITCDATLKNINVNKLFFQMENFGQDYLVDKHLRGIANADLQLATVWGKDLSVDMDKIYARSNITIEKGELIAFQPFIDIANDLKKDVVMRELIDVDEFKNKMEHIRFTNMQNEIEIKKQVIHVPQMEVKSSAMNIVFFGTHTFKNEIDYHFSFLLAEILTKQKKKRIEQNKEFGVEEDDGTGRTLYYTMTGTTDDFKFKKDYKTKKEKRKEDIKKEKQNLREILREEFGWFKKDTANKKKNDPKTPDKFILKWEDDAKKEEIPGDEDF